MPYQPSCFDHILCRHPDYTPTWTGCSPPLSHSHRHSHRHSRNRALCTMQ